MQVIKKARSSIEKAWGKGKIKDSQYRLMKYIFSVECEDGILLHNVLTGELVRLDYDEKIFLESLPQKDIARYKDLVEKHFLVPLDYDEKKVVTQLRQVLRTIKRRSSIVNYTILPTTYCNARCFYCYECDYEHIHMTEERAHEVVRYIIDHCQGKKVSLHWFGGEPLLGAKIISLISRELKEKGIEFSATMISNGSLFDEKLVQEAVKLWNLKSVQITIDGTEDVYNHVKDYVSMKKSPYQRVLRNIRLLAEAEIRVSIRINMGFHNVDDTKQLIQELSGRFKDCKGVSLYVHELFNGEGMEPRNYTQEEWDYLTELVNQFNDYAVEQGMYHKEQKLPALAITHCMADNDSSVIIQPGGELTKCEHSSAIENFGSIYSEDWDQKSLQSWKKYAEQSECEGCPLYPSCLYPAQCPERGQCFSGNRKKKLEIVEASMLEAVRKADEVIK